MYAVIEDGGRQFKVAEGDLIDVDLRDAAVGDVLAFDRVLFYSNGDAQQVGAPTVENARVLGKVEAEIKGKKTTHFTLRRRKDSRRKVGHRQRYLRVRITEVVAS